MAGRHAGEPAWPGGPPRLALADLDTAGQDLLLIAVGDGAVAEVAARLACRPQARVVLHTSGSLDASALAPLRAAGSAIGSLHPLKAFPQPLPDPAEARGVFFAVDGDPRGAGAGLPAGGGLGRRGRRGAGRGAAALPLRGHPGGRRRGDPARRRRGDRRRARPAGGGDPRLPGARPGSPRRRRPRPGRAGRSPPPSPAPSPATTARPCAGTSPPSASLTPGKLPLAIFLLGETLHQTGREEGEAWAPRGSTPREENPILGLPRKGQRHVAWGVSPRSAGQNQPEPRRGDGSLWAGR